MSQNIDLSGPAVAEALRIADSLLREQPGSNPPAGADTQQQQSWLEHRCTLIALYAHKILREFSIAVDETNRKLAKISEEHLGGK